jgi:hypothetical protein
MGDSSFVTLLSIVPLLGLLLSVAALVLAWRSKRSSVRRLVAFLLLVVGMACILLTAGALFFMAGGVLIAAMGLVLLIVSRRSKTAT